MNSCLYEGVVMHRRSAPKHYQFKHGVFMFYLDLDELDDIDKNFRWVSRNRFNYFEFRDSDHLVLSSSTIRENILEYLKTKGVSFRNPRIMLLTHLRTLGHIFNPISVYFFFEDAWTPAGALCEVGNTYGELKPYWLGPEVLQEDSYVTQQTKYYYISPFIDLDAVLDFELRIPSEKLYLRVDDLKYQQRFFEATMTGSRLELNPAHVWKMMLRYPFITLKVIFLIHWHAFNLYLRKIPFHRKGENQEMQKEVFRKYRGPDDKL